MYKIAVDIDDVLAQFYPAMCRRFNQPCKQIDIWDGKGEAKFVAENFHIVERNRMFWMNLEKLSRPEDFTFEVDYYITSSPRFIKKIREEWLQAYNYPIAPVISTSDKAAEMRRLGVNVLIDDNVKNLESIRDAGFIPIQFVPSYMRIIRSDLNPITHLSEVPDVLARLNR